MFPLKFPTIQQLHTLQPKAHKYYNKTLTLPHCQSIVLALIHLPTTLMSHYSARISWSIRSVYFSLCTKQLAFIKISN